METPVKVAIEFDLEYEVGSPADDLLEVDRIGPTPIDRWESVWMSREGLIEGFLINGQTRLYPHFTDTARRTIFAAFNQEATTGGGSVVIVWGGSGWGLTHIFLVTDDGWTNPLVVGGGQDGGWWFACEGELESDYRIWKKGVPGTVTL